MSEAQAVFIRQYIMIRIMRDWLEYCQTWVDIIFNAHISLCHGEVISDDMTLYPVMMVKLWI